MKTLLAKTQNVMYERQHQNWLDRQVRLIKSGQVNEIDFENIAQELEDMGNEAEAAVTSFMRQIMIHLCKLEFVKDQMPASHWRAEVANFRAELDDRIVNRFTNEDKINQIYEKAWKKVPSILVHLLSRDEHDRIPDACPYSLEQLRDDGFFPSLQCDEKESMPRPRH